VVGVGKEMAREERERRQEKEIKVGGGKEKKGSVRGMRRGGRGGQDRRGGTGRKQIKKRGGEGRKRKEKE